MNIEIGGKRIGSGNKMNTAMHNYGRSTHDLTQSFKSTLAAGVLYPFLKILCINEDTVEIDLHSMLRTLPTIAPLFGSYKLQLDVYKVPFRLYQGILHNNPIDIGLSMNQVKLPKLKLPGCRAFSLDFDNSQISSSALIKYLGMSGVGRNAGPADAVNWYRYINAIPLLGYYDIFKNYYANKQEENAYVIVPDNPSDTLITFDVKEWNEADEIIQQFNTVTSYATASTPTKILLTFSQNVSPTEIAVIHEDETKSLTTWASDQNATMQTYSRITRDGIKYYIEILVPEGASIYESLTTTIYKKDIKLQSFALKNIDKMREKILNFTQLGQSFIVGESENTNFLPYITNVQTTLQEGFAYNTFPMNGLVVKTYQADIYNNWLKTEWITGSNGIAELTAVSTQGNKLYLDALNLSQKVYNMLNRIAMSGGTYQDWQRAVYGNAARDYETPEWVGGMSSEVVFEEVISTADTNDQALGGLAGKGRLAGRKGGHMRIDIHEPSYIIGILSLTPRIDYTQGNDFDLTDLDSLDDLHKPELDGIGFQDLLIERFAWFDTKVLNGQVTRNSAGKIPAWLEYMTAVDKAFGGFADTSAKYMILSRQYSHNGNGDVSDVTTYIDPKKYNYMFAYTALDSQNFWAQVVSDIKIRRKISARVIPNL